MTRHSILALAALLSSIAGIAKADDVAPMSGKSIAIDAASGTVYYTPEAAGFRVVATMSTGENSSPIRFVATLADGQAVTVSIPTEVGKEPKEIEISRIGETLSVNAVEAVMVRASLD